MTFFGLDLLAPLKFISKLQLLTIVDFRTSFENKELSKEEFIRKLEKSRTDLEASIQILSYEPEESPEGTFCKTARQFKSQLESFLKRLESI